ncbi:hypothetical protein HK096_008340 [Nowakowskiella sp. JEL0078]|nr:hypothetical protein HK096_008340 [Nowakowskiella sp. JEL0078]
MKLNCKLGSSVFPVEVKPYDTIGDLKEKIKDKNKEDLATIDARNLSLIRVYSNNDKTSGVKQNFKFNQLITNIQEILASGENPEDIETENDPFPYPGYEWKSDYTKVHGKVMLSSGKCSSYELSRDSEEFTVDFIVILPHIPQVVESPSSSKKRKSTTGQITSTKKSRKPTFIERQEETFEYIRKGIGSPSTASSTKSVKDLANGKTFLLNKRFGEGLPASLYCKAFRDFKRRLKETPKVTLMEVETAEKIALKMKKVFKKESDRRDSFINLWNDSVFFPDKERRLMPEISIEDYRADGGIKSITVEDFIRMILILEVKSELGASDSDGTIQADLYYAKHLALLEDKVKEICKRCCYPTVLVQLIGSYIQISGAITRDVIHVETLLPFVPLLPDQNKQATYKNIAHIFQCLSILLSDLLEFYNNLPSAKDSEMQRFYPFIRDITDRKTQEPRKLFYVGNEKFEGNHSHSGKQNLMQAELRDVNGNKVDDVVVKIIPSYGTEVHIFAEENGFAPTLYFASDDEVPGYSFVVMNLPSCCAMKPMGKLPDAPSPC